MLLLVNTALLKYLGTTSDLGAQLFLEALDDAAVIHNIVLKSDSHTVEPFFFPGTSTDSIVALYLNINNSIFVLRLNLSQDVNMKNVLEMEGSTNNLRSLVRYNFDNFNENQAYRICYECIELQKENIS